MRGATPIIDPQPKPKTIWMPTWLAAIGFGVVGVLCAYLFTEKESNTARALISGGLSASIVGAVVWYLHPRGTRLRAVSAGVLAGFLASLVFWPLYVYTGVYMGGTWVAENPSKASEAISLLMVFGILVVSPVAMALGAATGALLHLGAARMPDN